MKLSSVLKVFGTAALVAGLTPYRVTRDEETGGKKYRALFWEATSASKKDGGEKPFSLQVGFFSPLEKEDDEPHFFADELTVEYTRKEEAGDTAEVDETAPEQAEEETAAEDAAAASEEVTPLEAAEEAAEPAESSMEE